MSVRTRPHVTLYGSRLQHPRATGISRYARQLLRAIAAAPPAELDIAMASSPEAAGPEGLPADLPYHRLPGSRRAWHVAWAALHRPAIDRFVGQPDLLHVLYPSFPVPSRASVVYTIHDLVPFHHPEWFANYERWGFREAARDAARRATALITVSRAVADQVHTLLEVERARIHVVHLGVGGEFTRPVDPADQRAACARYGLRPDRYLVAVGNVAPRKNLPTVVEAMAQMDPASRLPLLVVGPDGVGAAAVRALVGRRGLEDQVRFTGWLPSSELPPLIAGARALVHPSVEEGFGMTPLEAMAAGIPTAVARAGTLPEVVGQAALLVDAYDPRNWAEALASVCEDSELRAELRRRGRVQAARFTWQHTAAQTLDVYRQVLASA
ncbi:MAG: glycosyltransferase family 4 protein [Acidimicrobiales bacterium]